MTTTPSNACVPAKAPTLQKIARLTAVLLLAALLVPSASAQFIYVANSGEDTVSKIDINPPYKEVARYATWFTSGTNHVPQPHTTQVGPAPSRLLQDSAGNLFVLNRFFPQRLAPPNLPPPGLHLPVLLKIAPSGGTAATTSTGPVAKPMLDDGTTSNEIDSGDTKDARILWAKNIGNAGDEGALGRALCMDTTGVLWVGLWGKYQGNTVAIPNMQKYYRVDASTGQILPPLNGVLTPGHSPYGCQVDTNGKLWSIDGDNQLLEIDTATRLVVPPTHIHGFKPGSPTTDFGTNYALSLFNGCGSAPSKIYLSERKFAKTYIAYDPQTSLFSNAPTAIPQFTSWTIGVDLHGDIVSGEYATGRVMKTTPTGTVLWDTKPPPAGPAVPTTDLHGIIIDEHNDVWAVHLVGDRVVKYSGGDGHWIATVPVGVAPYTYGNPPPPTCPCAVTSEPQITCKGKDKDGKWLYEWSFVVTNHSPFSMPATTVDISAPTGSPITGLLPQQFTFPTPLPPKGQATVTGTFTLAQPIPGTQICFDIRLNAGDGWCCPLEHVCFIVPDCTCANLQGVFKCAQGRPYLELSVTNLGPTAAAGAQIFSNTPGVTVSPATTTLAFPQNTPVIVPLTVTGATPGQIISLSVMLHGPIDPKTGVHSWCCTATVKVTYPAKICWWWPDGDIFDDVNANGVRDSGEGGLAEWIVTLTDAKGKAHATKSDASGKYQFKEIEPGKSRLSVQPPQGWRATAPKGGAFSLTVEAPPKEKLDFGFVKTR